MLGWKACEGEYDVVDDDEYEKDDDGIDEYGVCTLGSSYMIIINNKTPSN